MSVRLAGKSASAVLLLMTMFSFGQEWPQWRGAVRDGTIQTHQLPARLPETLQLNWKVTVGLGHSSPVVAGDRIYQFARQGEREVVSCLDPATGRVLWEQGYPAPYTMNRAARSHGKGPKSTPLVNDGKIFTLGISGILSAFDAGSGKLLWRKDFVDQFPKTSPLYGAAMSPVTDRGHLIAHLGGHGAGALLALSVETGETRWSWTGDGPGYASPIIVELQGTRQVVTQSQDHLIGVDANSGKLLWKIPFETAYTQNAVTPVIHNDNLIFSGLDRGIQAFRFTPGEEGWKAKKVWENDELSMYMSSPVLVGDLMFGLSHYKKGQFFCLDVLSGRTLWTSPGRQADNAAILTDGELLFFLTTDAQLIVASASRAGFESAQSYAVAESPTWAHPVILDNRVLVKDESNLALWSVE
jgi:outer membrane protein assembly factor BamB